MLDLGYIFCEAVQLCDIDESNIEDIVDFADKFEEALHHIKQTKNN